MRFFIDCPICGKSLMLPETKGYTESMRAKKAMYRHVAWTHPAFGVRDRSEIIAISSNHIHDTRNAMILVEAP